VWGRKENASNKINVNIFINNIRLLLDLIQYLLFADDQKFFMGVRSDGNVLVLQE